MPKCNLKCPTIYKWATWAAVRRDFWCWSTKLIISIRVSSIWWCSIQYWVSRKELINSFLEHSRLQLPFQVRSRQMRSIVMQEMPAICRIKFSKRRCRVEVHDSFCSLGRAVGRFRIHKKIWWRRVEVCRVSLMSAISLQRRHIVIQSSKCKSCQVVQKQRWRILKLWGSKLRATMLAHVLRSLALIGSHRLESWSLACIL